MEMRLCVFFFQAEDGIRDLVRSRGLGDVYKRQAQHSPYNTAGFSANFPFAGLLLKAEGAYQFGRLNQTVVQLPNPETCLLYTSDAADERSSVDLGGRRIIKKKKIKHQETDSKNEEKEQ